MNHEQAWDLSQIRPPIDISYGSRRGKQQEMWRFILIVEWRGSLMQLDGLRHTMIPFEGQAISDWSAQD